MEDRFASHQSGPAQAADWFQKAAALGLAKNQEVLETRKKP